MNKSDYDKYYKKGGTYVIPVELFNELFDELEGQTSNYEQALEDLDKKDKELEARKQLINKQDKELWTLEHTIKEVREYFKNHTLKYDDLMLIKPSDVLEILDKEVN